MWVVVDRQKFERIGLAHSTKALAAGFLPVRWLRPLQVRTPVGCTRYLAGGRTNAGYLAPRSIRRNVRSQESSEVFAKRQRIVTKRHKGAYSKVGVLNAEIMTSPLLNSPSADRA